MDNNKYYPMNSAELLDSVLDVYKKSFLKQIAVSMIFGTIFSVILYVVLFTGILGFAFNMVGSAYASVDPGDIFRGLLPSIIFFTILIAFIAIIYISMVATGHAIITKQTFLNEPTDIGKVLKQTFKKLIPVGTTCIAELIVLLPVLILMGIFIYIYIMMLMEIVNFNTIPSTLTIIATIGIAILMIVVSLLCSTVTIMSTSAAVFENKYFFSAVKKSFQLMKPDFLKILGLLTVWTLIISAISYSLTSATSLISILGEWILPQEIAGIVALISTGIGYMLSMAVSVLLAPLSGIFATMMYINQRFKHEGLDIELNLNAISTERLKTQFMNQQKIPPMPNPYNYGYNPGGPR